MGGNGEPLAHGRIWSGPLKLLLPALCLRSHSTLEITYLAACSVTPAVLKACGSSAPPSVVRGEDRIGDHSVPWWQYTLHSPHSTVHTHYSPAHSVPHFSVNRGQYTRLHCCRPPVASASVQTGGALVG